MLRSMKVARGKYLSLEEARRDGQLDQFAKEHPSEADAELFDRLLRAMTEGKPVAGAGTLDAGTSAGSSDTRSPTDTSEDA